MAKKFKRWIPPKYKSKAPPDFVRTRQKKFKRIKIPTFRTTAKQTQKRSIVARQLLSAGGINPYSSGKKRGAGRPTGTYKYGVPIQEWKKLQSQRKALRDVERQQLLRKLQRQGFTEEQVQMFQQQRILDRFQSQAPKVPTSIADEELRIQEQLAANTISPNTQRILDQLRRTQNKARQDNIDMQRRNAEKRLVAQAGNILKTPFIFKEYQMDPTGDRDDNILRAPNIFKQDPENLILKPRRLNILQTREAGNSLWF